MVEFKVGDRARVLYIRNRATPGWEEGAEVVIVDIVKGFNTIGKYDCIVCFGGSHLATVLFEQLEPIVNLGSWKEIEESIGWNPMKETLNEV